MTKIVLEDTNSGYNLSKINANFDAIEEFINDKALSRSNPTDDPNQMVENLDMNGQRIINLPSPISSNEPVRFQDLLNATLGILPPIPASLISNTPGHGITSTDVQTALYELSDEVTLEITNRNAAISAEATTRSAADTILTTNVSANTTAITNIIGALVTANQVVLNIAVLKTVPKTNNVWVSTRGYYAAGDLGAGTYYCDLSDTTSADNGGTIIVASDGGRWKLIHNGLVTVNQFGAKGDGVQDDTNNINTCITTMGFGGRIHFPAPSVRYRITNSINLNQTGQQITGANQYGCLISSDTMNTPIFNITASFVTFDGFALIYNGTPVAGATCIYVNGASNVTGSRFVNRNGYNSVVLTNTSGCYFSQFKLYDYSNYGYFADTSNDCYASQFIFQTSNTTTAQGIRLTNHVEAFNFTDGDILGGLWSITTDASSNTIGLRPAYCSFTGVYFDSSSNGSSFNNSVDFKFTSSWFSGGRASASNGCSLAIVDEFTFNGTDFFNNGNHGLLIGLSAKRTKVIGCTIDSNSATAGANVGHGIAVAAGATDFIIKDNVCHNGNGSGTQGWGIFIGSGASDRYIVSGNLVSGNGTGGVTDGGTGANKSVTANF